MKILINSILILFALLPRVIAQGQTQVNYSAQLSQPNVHTLGGGAVADGNSVWLGAFDSGYDVTVNQNDPLDLLSNWNEYDTTTITTLMPFNQQGSFNDSRTSTSAVFNNLKMYLWIFSTDDGLAPETDFGNVNAYGLFSSTDLDWVFPPVNTPFPGNTKDIYTSDVNQAQHGSFDLQHLYLHTFNPVPEPSTLGLLSIAVPALVLALRKRRAGQ